jgi:ferrous iron transport protein B
MAKDRAAVAVAGNPNTGKTTLFNGLTGSRQRVGNWPGVTVEKKEGVIDLGGSELTLVDLPGVYALSASSEDERVARDFILSGEAELIINIVDAANLERNLYLTLQLLEMRAPVLLALNMMDLATQAGISIDADSLSRSLGCPVIGISATSRGDLRKVKETVKRLLASPQPSERLSIEYPAAVETALASWLPQLASVKDRLPGDSRWVATKLMEQDPWITDMVVATGALTEDAIRSVVGGLESALGESPDVVLANRRFELIQAVVRDAVQRAPRAETSSDRIDRVVMHRLLGIPVFLLVMYALFSLTMSIGGGLIDFFDMLFGTVLVDGLGRLLAQMGSPEWIIALLAGGIGGGIQTVATFVPVIGVMFLLLSLLEDSGYMARAAFVMDRLMRWIGLPGKAFVPLLVGFGCTVPAIMATRTLDSKRDRFLTVFMAPLMSCGARLPVYALFGAAFFGARAGLMVFSLYLAGIILAVLTGLLFKNTLFRGEASHFVMELPPYHMPNLRNILAYTWHRLRLFVLRAGRVIVMVVLILSFLNTMGIDGTVGNEDTPNSLLSHVGRAVTPVFEPMGIERDNWPASVGLFVGVFAKEAIIGTVNSLYGQMGLLGGEADGVIQDKEEPFDFWGGIREAFATIPQAFGGMLGALRDPFGVGLIAGSSGEIADEVGADAGVYDALRSNFTHGPLQAYAYLLFVLIYFPCVAALGAVIRELGRGYAWLLMGYLTAAAWSIATLFYQVTVVRNPVWIATPTLLLMAMMSGLAWLGKRLERPVRLMSRAVEVGAARN